MFGNGADVLLNLLTQVGVKSLYGVSGDAIFGLLDALSRRKNINYYMAACESGAAFMAHGEAVVTRRLSACIATSGPGTVNMLNGLAEAYYDKVPVLAITGQVATVKIGTRAKQFFHQQPLVKNFSQVSEMIVSPDTLVPTVLSAIHIALDHKTVVHLAIPQDIFLKPVTGNLTIPQGIHKRISLVDYGNTSLGKEEFVEKIENVVAIIQGFQQPVIIIGDRCPNVGKYIYKLSETIGAAVIVAQQVRGAIPEDLPQVLGALGNSYRPSLIDEVDGIILVGDCPYEKNLIPSIPLVQIARQVEDIYYDKTTHWIKGDPIFILQSIEKGLKDVISNPLWVNKIRKERENQKKLREQYIPLGQSQIHPMHIMTALKEVIAPDAVICLDIGSFTHWFEQGFKVKQQQIMLSGLWRSMGSAVPKAIGAKIANPSKQVVAMVGDGGMLMSLGELFTIAKYQIPITIIVVNNGGYMLEKQKMIKKNLAPYGYDIPPLDFSTIAEGFGIPAIRVNSPEQLHNSMTTALKECVPNVIDISTIDMALQYSSL